MNPATWLSPYMAAYSRVYGFWPTEPTVKRLARAVRSLEKITPPLEVLRRFENYLKATTPQFYSAERFSAVFPFWADEQPTKGIPGQPPPPELGESGDAYCARLIRLGW